MDTRRIRQFSSQRDRAQRVDMSGSAAAVESWREMRVKTFSPNALRFYAGIFRRSTLGASAIKCWRTVFVSVHPKHLCSMLFKLKMLKPDSAINIAFKILTNQQQQ
jgi:hypothetical protein